MLLSLKVKIGVIFRLYFSKTVVFYIFSENKRQGTTSHPTFPIWLRRRRRGRGGLERGDEGGVLTLLRQL